MEAPRQSERELFRKSVPIGKVESRRIIDEAHIAADEIRRGADEYAVSVLVGLEGDVTNTLNSIQKGIALLDDRRAQLIAQTDDAEPGVAEDDWQDDPQDAPAPARS